MPTPGLEPGRPYGQGILSPLRLPIPPSGQFIYSYKLIFLIYRNIISLLFKIYKIFLHFFY